MTGHGQASYRGGVVRIPGTSKSLDPADPWVGTDDYDLAVIAPNIYLTSWMGDDGHVVSAVFNLDEMTVHSTYSSPEPERFAMSGIITEVR